MVSLIDQIGKEEGIDQPADAKKSPCKEVHDAQNMVTEIKPVPADNANKQPDDVGNDEVSFLGAKHIDVGICVDVNGRSL